MNRPQSRCRTGAAPRGWRARLDQCAAVRLPDSGEDRNQRGVALLAVLWLAVALSFMGMATSQLVRTEVTALSNQIDSERSYYLARGGIDAAAYSIALATLKPPDPSSPDQPTEFRPGKRWLRFDFQSGSCVVEVAPENAKLNVNRATPEQLTALFDALGIPPEKSAQLAAATVEWRTARTSNIPTALDSYYADLPHPYVARHAPLDDVEELLPVKGMSRNLFFGRTELDPDGKWQRWPALTDLLTTDPSATIVNPNYAPYEVLRSLPGWTDAMAAAVVAARAVAPFQSLGDLEQAVPQFPQIAARAPLTLQEGPLYTLTATGFLTGSGVRRSARALVLIDVHRPLYHRVLAWWDDWPSPSDIPAAITGAGSSGNGG